MPFKECIMKHDDYYQLFKTKDFTNPARVYSKTERQDLNCPDRMTNYEIHRYLMLCYECRQAEVSSMPIPEIAMNAKFEIIRIASERKKTTGSCAGLFNVCYGNTGAPFMPEEE